MENGIKKYVTSEKLSYFLNKIAETFSKKGHTHNQSDIIDLNFALDAIDDEEGNVTLIQQSNVNVPES